MSEGGMMSPHPEENDILHRIIRASGIPGLLDALVSGLSLSDLQSLLLHVYKERTSSLSPADVLRQYRNNRFVKFSDAAPPEILQFDSLAFSMLPEGFQPVELSPVSPLGASSVLGPVDQNNAVTTIRNTEVLSDPTNVMALECAVRRQAGESADLQREVKLCCSHRITRAQRFEGPASFPHFRMLSLCTSGRDRGSHIFETEAVIEHVDYYLRILKATSSPGYYVDGIRVKLIILSGNILHVLNASILDKLKGLHPNAAFEMETGANNPGGYYRSLRFNIFATNRQGEEFFLVDGGFTDWTQKLLNDRKERFMTSAMGTERFLVCFR
jgi:hypothetical protein